MPKYGGPVGQLLDLQVGKPFKPVLLVSVTSYKNSNSLNKKNWKKKERECEASRQVEMRVSTCLSILQLSQDALFISHTDQASKDETHSPG